MSTLLITVGLVSDTDSTLNTDQLEEIVIWTEASQDELQRSKPDSLEEMIIWIEPLLSEELQITTNFVIDRSEVSFNRQRGWTWIQLDVEIAES
ncbi:hypothetical protein PSPO01_14857 [Paraphaeosphaeria sporulosa]